MCGWTNVISISRGKRVLWLRIRPDSMYIKGNLLKNDHTTMSQLGNYLVMPYQMHSKATYFGLRSPIIRPRSRTGCFRFYYFAMANKSGVTAFTVRFLELSRKKSTKETISVKAMNQMYWKKFEIQFDNLPSAYQILIEGDSNSRGITSDIGIDDINIQPYGCKAIVEPQTTTTPSEKVWDCTFDNNNNNDDDDDGQINCNWSYDHHNWIVTNSYTSKI